MGTTNLAFEGLTRAVYYHQMVKNWSSNVQHDELRVEQLTTDELMRVMVRMRFEKRSHGSR